SLNLKTDSVLTCIAFNTMALGGTVYFMYSIVGDKGTTLSISSGKLPNIKLPIIDGIPIIGDILSNHNILSYVAILMIFLVYIFINRTPIGLRIRAAGESP